MKATNAVRIAEELQRYVTQEVLRRKEGVGMDTPLVESGLLDSLGLLFQPWTRTAAAMSGPKAFAEAGISPADVDMFAMYDSFTYTVLVVLEDLGFAPKGEGGAFVTDGGGNLRLGGALPTNTDGGGLSCTHPGMRGLFLMCEATRQLRGEAG